MARPSKLTTVQCARIRALKNDPINPVPASQLAKRFKVSESSIYKVLDGSYVAREVAADKIKAPTVHQASCGTATSIPEVTPVRPAGAMPSIFQGSSTPRRRSTDRVPGDQGRRSLAEILENAAKADVTAEVDELTLAAAELIVARAKFNQALHLAD